jgi:hypothetical protein
LIDIRIKAIRHFPLAHGGENDWRCSGAVSDEFTAAASGDRTDCVVCFANGSIVIGASIDFRAGLDGKRGALWNEDLVSHEIVVGAEPGDRLWITVTVEVGIVMHDIDAGPQSAVKASVD